MKQWQHRVHEERAVLMYKYTKLKHYLATVNIEEVEQGLLKEQAEIMKQYIQILDRRMIRWNRLH